MRVSDLMMRTIVTLTQALPATIGPFEFRAGLFPLLIGLWLALPQATFTSAIGYVVLARLMPEWAWALALIGLGATQMTMAACRAPLHYRRVVASSLVFIWSIWTVCFWLGNPASLGIAAYLLAAADQAVVYLRIGLDEPLRDAQSRG